MAFEQRRNVARELACGMCGGTIAALITYPIDTIKTRMQTGMFPSIVSTIKTTLKQEGFVGFYRGFAIPIVSQPMYMGGAFGGLELGRYLFDNFVWPHPRGPEDSRWRNTAQLLVAGCISGICAATAVTPGDRLKVLTQSQRTGRQDIRNTIRNIWHHGGLRSFYRGWGACLSREVPGCVIWFGAYEATSSRLMAEAWPRPVAVLCGGVAAALACWLTCMPFDRVKTLQQVSLQHGHRDSMVTIMRSIAQQDGWTGFYRGLKPILARAVIMDAVQFSVADQVRRLLQ